MLLRVSASAILLFSVLFLPFWVTVILALIGIGYFSFFFEAVAILFVSDLLYGAKEAKFFGIVFISFIISVVLITVAELLKRKLKFYP